MPRKAGLRQGLIYKLIDSYLFALSNGELQLAGVHLKTLAEFLKIKIQPTPLFNIVTPSESQVWLNYCVQNQPVVFKGIDINLIALAKKNTPFRLDHGDDSDDDGDVDVE